MVGIFAWLVAVELSFGWSAVEVDPGSTHVQHMAVTAAGGQFWVAYEDDPTSFSHVIRIRSLDPATSVLGTVYQLSDPSSLGMVGNLSVATNGTHVSVLYSVPDASCGVPISEFPSILMEADFDTVAHSTTRHDGVVLPLNHDCG